VATPLGKELIIMEKKMTKKQMFEMIKGVCVDNVSIVEFCNHEIELLEKKNGSKGLTKVQKENESIKPVILEVMRDIGRPVTIGELAKDERLSQYSSNKISALVKQLKDNETVIRTEDKKVAYFSIAE
jgi:hypothetical protein